MASAATRLGPAPRYGSPAEVAAFLGVSVKTVRRQVDSGALPSYRVGRRVLVPYRDADRVVRPTRNRRAPTMAVAPATEPPVSPRRSFDARGRALPLTAEEIRRRNEEAIRGLEALDAMGDEDEQRQTLDALLKALDDGPP
jgi:excisionase family DNA binding protein